MTPKTFPLNRERLEEICRTHPTPFHIYDEAAIRKNARAFAKAFDWTPGGFKNFFAVKACPNPHILKIGREEGMGTDCSSLVELMLSDRVGVRGEEIMFSSNDTPAEEFVLARKLGAIINLDDLGHIGFLEKTAGLPELLSLRYNPGPLKKGNDIIGKPEEAKYGFPLDQLVEGYRILKAKGVKRFGIHTMVASNEINSDYFIETATVLFDAMVRVRKETGIAFEFVNLGGGVGIPYRPEQNPVDFEYVSKRIHEAYRERLEANGMKPRVFFECGRMIAGPYGWLVSRVRHVKRTYRVYVGLDACMANLMRPALYGAYHHITVLGKNGNPTETVDVVGSLCENNDKFAIQRDLPKMEPGDLVVIHDAGAHGYAMGFNYNGKLRSAELLLKPDGGIEKIRRAETPEDYFATMIFPD